MLYKKNIFIALVVLLSIGMMTLSACSKKIEDVGGTRLVLQLDEAAIQEKGDNAIDQTIELLAARLKNMHVKHASFTRLENGRVQVDIPQPKFYSEEEYFSEFMPSVRRSLMCSGNLQMWETYEITELEMWIVQLDSLQPYLSLNSGGRIGIFSSDPVIGTASYADMDKVDAILTSPSVKSFLPQDVRFAWSFAPLVYNEPYYQLIALKAQKNGGPYMEGAYGSEIKAEIYPSSFSNNYVVNIKMTEQGAADWEQMTKANIERSIAMVIDGYVYSYPTVMCEISGGQANITGNYTKKEAQLIAGILTYGPLPMKPQIIAENYIPKQK